MPQFQVPQFIEEKPKIVGPLTLTQFFYIGGAAAIGILAFYTINIPFLSFLIAAIVGAVGLSLAFVKINGLPLPSLIGAALTYWQKPKRYAWKRELPTVTIDASSAERIHVMRQNMSLQEKIKTAALNVTTGAIPLFRKKDKQRGQRNEYQVVSYLTGERRLAKRVDYKENT
ncbi:MAG TPA: PrgI family protein [Candidatus Jorgensenbacteria bacterium]|uniref:PrgI family protein n=1 Tax=marine sediment metagenome TaxID=412755 RepID=A0A0F9DEH3_9ZZZZ|nr:PrgI family protein [Candidatus Jorgensenbacteria bacterium]